MKYNVGFLTGARSEYEMSKYFLKKLSAVSKFELKIYTTAMHNLEKFGNTGKEIEKDGFKVNKKIVAYNNANIEKAHEFSSLLNSIYNELKSEKLDAVFLIGDRLEAYAAALAAHFLKIKIIHSGGGNITRGAVDNIYRYNISNLADIHLATSKSSYERLLKLPTLNKDKIFFVGSIAIDNIVNLEVNNIKTFLPDINNHKFVLMTFHPVTKGHENISNIMNECIDYIIKENFDLLITYPNNDEGFQSILDTIDKWNTHNKVFLSKSLGAEAYYAALKNCSFVIGNSSSGVIEAPYFNQLCINVGSRQDGRDKDTFVFDCEANINKIKVLIDKVQNIDKSTLHRKSLFGSGNASNLIIDILSSNL